MALFAPKSVKNVATTTADKAKTTGGINDLYPYLSAFSLVSLAVGICIAAGCTKPTAVKIAKTIIHAPVIHVRPSNESNS